jgi:acetolactate synthase-1/2/3 large subunit
MKITGAEILIKTLEKEGVDTIFGYPGASVLAIYDTLLKSNIKHVLVRQEQAAVHAASGYSRTTGKIGVCMSTSGPGATNLVTGIATAYMDSIPIVIFTGQVSTNMVGTDAFQEVDITGITMPVTKHNFLVKDVKDLSRIVREAFHIAGTGRPGPVLIDIPKNVSEDLVKDKISEKIELRGYKPNYKGHPTQIKNAASLINKSQRPVIFTGGGVIRYLEFKELNELLEKTGAPITTTLSGIGAFPEPHQQSLGMLGMHGTPYANYAVTDCDLLVGLGVRFDDRVTSKIEKFAPNAKKIHIDIDPAEIGKNVNIDIPIVGDLKKVLDEMLPLIEEKNRDEWLNKINEYKRVHPLKYNKDEKLSPQYIIEKLGELTKNNDVVVTADVGQHQMWAAQHFKFESPGSFLTSGGLGTMGYGFPAAVGVQMADKKKLVIAVTGDGSFQMHMAELGTAMENNLPIKILLLNNNSLALVKQLQHIYCNKKYSAVDFRCNPDFISFAKCYGAEGVRITTNDEVEPKLQEALGNNMPTIIECIISSEEKVYPMVLANKGINEMIQYEEGE